MEEILRLLTIFALCATMGWIIEFVYRSINRKKLVNPGFLTGMALPIYGLGGIIMYLFSYLFIDMPILLKLLFLFVSSSIFMTLLELIGGIIFLKYYKVKLWDYSKLKFNYKGVICLQFSLIWGVLATIYIMFLQGYIVDIGNYVIHNEYSMAALIIYYFIFISDLLISLRVLNRLKKMANELKVIVIMRTVLEDTIKFIDKKGSLKKLWLFFEPSSVVNRYVSYMNSKKIKRDYWKENERLIDSIIKRRKYQTMKKYYAHKNVSCYEHTLRVCKGCLDFVNKYRIKCDIQSLIRGALLHDYYLYDWHKNPPFTFHGFKHNYIAMKNADKEFKLNKKEKNMIYSHMFPLTFWAIPLSKEAWILTIVDKIEATKDMKR